MAKIRITENELKEIIRESVEYALNENSRYNYGMPWEKLTEPEKQAFVQHYAKSPFHRNAYSGGDPLEQAKQVYNRKRARKGGKDKLSYSADQFNRTVEPLRAKAESANKALLALQNIENELNQIAEGKSKNMENILEDSTYTYTSTATTDAQGNTQTDRTYNDQFKFIERGNAIIAKIQALKKQVADANENATKWKNAYTKLQTTNIELTKANQNLNQQISAANQARMQNTAASALNRQATTAQVNAKMPGANNSASALNTNPQRTTAAGTTKA